MSDGREPVFTGQGTRLSETNPWDSWDKEWEDGTSPELEAEIAEYAQHRYEDGQSSSESREVLAEMRERSMDAAEEYKWLREEDYNSEEARRGRVMTHADFITILRKAGVQCFYRQHPHPDKAVLWFVDSEGKEQRGPWVQLGYVPELSIMNFDDHGVPLAERKRGWRTPLLQLILASAISERSAVKYFGEPRQTKEFAQYNGYIYAFRNRNVEKI